MTAWRARMIALALSRDILDDTDMGMEPERTLGLAGNVDCHATASRPLSMILALPAT